MGQWGEQSHILKESRVFKFQIFPSKIGHWSSWNVSSLCWRRSQRYQRYESPIFGRGRWHDVQVRSSNINRFGSFRRCPIVFLFKECLIVTAFTTTPRCPSLPPHGLTLLTTRFLIPVPSNLVQFSLILACGKFPWQPWRMLEEELALWLMGASTTRIRHLSRKFSLRTSWIITLKRRLRFHCFSTQPGFSADPTDKKDSSSSLIPFLLFQMCTLLLARLIKSSTRNQ